MEEEWWVDDAGQKWVKRSDSGPFTRHLSLFLACQDKEDGYPLSLWSARTGISAHWENGSVCAVFLRWVPRKDEYYILLQAQ